MSLIRFSIPSHEKLQTAIKQALLLVSSVAALDTEVVSKLAASLEGAIGVALVTVSLRVSATDGLVLTPLSSASLFWV